jgi:hypothetical protein
MALTFRSSISETFTLTGMDTHGRKRAVTATKASNDFHWKLRLVHPSGRNWDASFHGPNVLDAMTELLTSKDIEFKQDGARGDRPPAEAFDGNVRVNDMTNAPIVPINRRW